MRANLLPFVALLFVVACGDSDPETDGGTTSPSDSSGDLGDVDEADSAATTVPPDVVSEIAEADTTVPSDTTSDTTSDTGEPPPVELDLASVGFVQIEVYPALPEVEQIGWSQFDVLLFDNPGASHHEVVATIGQCTRYNRKITQCTPECSPETICDAEGACVPIPEQRFAGTITWTRDSDGGQVSTTPNTAEPTYPYYPGHVVEGEQWADNGEKVTVTATGGDIPAFTAEVVGVAPMVASKTAPAFEYKTEYPEDVDLVWTPATAGAVVEVAFRTGHHVAPPASMVLCRAPDAQGHVVVAKELLVGMGFCTGICLFPHPSDITRVSRATVTTPGGPINVTVKTRGTLQTAPPASP